MEIPVIRENLETLPDKIYAQELKVTDLKVDFNFMNAMTKHILAKEKNLYEGSNASKEDKVHAGEVYKIHIAGLREQERKYLNSLAELNRLKNFYDSMRSLNKNI